MTKDEFVKSLPHIEEIKGLGASDLYPVLMRASGFLEAVEGMKQNPEIAARINLSELKLLQLMLRLVFSLQCMVLEQRERIEKFASLQNEINELKTLLSGAVEERNRFEDELNAYKEKRKNRV
jgi:hypothetical protein